MSKEVQQFVDLVQQAHSQLTEQVHYMYCQECGGRTAHKLSVRGRWEHYVCRVCGCRKSYKVR